MVFTYKQQWKVGATVWTEELQERFGDQDSILTISPIKVLRLIDKFGKAEVKLDVDKTLNTLFFHNET